MKKARQIFKMMGVALVMLVHIIIGYSVKLILSGDRRRRFQNKLVARSTGTLLRSLGVKLTVEGAHNYREGQAYLMVSNHLSWLDPGILANFKPILFVSTIEVKNTPLLGQLAEGGGCVYIERRSREQIREEISMLEGCLRRGFSLMFFPEGTSTNGSTVLPFKRPFFAPALQSRCPVLPLVIQLEEINGEKVTSANRDSVCWYGDMEFGPHIFALAGMKKGVKVRIKVLPEIPITDSTTREELAAKSHAAILANYQPIPEV